MKASQAIATLSQLTAPEAPVVRDGEQRHIPAAEVVAGDPLVLAEGDIVPADADAVDAAALLVDESALTGESVPVDKSAARGSDQVDFVSVGTVVVRGRGRAVVMVTDLVIVCALSTLGYAAVRLDRIEHRDKPPGGSGPVALGRDQLLGRRRTGARHGPERAAGATPSPSNGSKAAG